MLTLNTEAELIALHTGVVKESLHVEYKPSDAIDKKSDKLKLEMARDISAFANADGGQIIYGMKENKDHEPDGLDAGVDPREYPEIWFEQILQQHVTPLLPAAKPRHVPLSNGRVAVVVDVLASDGDPRPPNFSANHYCDGPLPNHRRPCKPVAHIALQLSVQLDGSITMCAESERALVGAGAAPFLRPFCCLLKHPHAPKRILPLTYRIERELSATTT
jgi:hypothetical protein